MGKRRLTVLAVCLLVILAAAWGEKRLDSVETGANTPAHTIIIIDPGHGGADGGAISASGVAESGINLAIAQRLQIICRLMGANTAMTRQNENSVHSPEAVTIRQQKVSDMKNRVEQINGAGDALLVSIHQNAYGTRATGAQVFYRPDSAESYALSVLTQDNLKTVLDPTNERRPARIPSGVYLFKNTFCPAILVECGFLSNVKEAELLQQEDYQLKTAVSVAAALLAQR